MPPPREPEPEPPGNVIGQIRVIAEAEVIPGPATLAAQAADEDEEPEG
jgi:hypothetical protein